MLHKVKNYQVENNDDWWNIFLILFDRLSLNDVWYKSWLLTVFCFQSNYSVIIFVESLDMLMQVDVHVNEDIQHKSTLGANVKTCSSAFPICPGLCYQGNRRIGTAIVAPPQVAGQGSLSFRYPSQVLLQVDLLDP